MLKIGLIGAGFLGLRHLRHLITLDKVQVSRIWDTNPTARQTAVKEFGVKAARSLEELIQESDAVDLVTPTSTHYEIGRRVLEEGIPLFVEKPLCAQVDQGQQLVELAECRGLTLQVGHIERFNRAFRALSGIAVKPQFIEAHRLAPWTPRGGDVAVVLDLMIHDLDLILTLAQGSEPVQVQAKGVGVVTDSVDIANARIEFASGLVANVTASRISLKRMRKLRLFGGQEYIALDLGKGECEYVGGTFAPASLPSGVERLGEVGLPERCVVLFRKFLQAPEGDAMRLELEAFRDAVQSGSLPTVSGRDGLRALELAEQIIKTIQSGGDGNSRTIV